MRALIQSYSFNATARTVTLTDFSAARPVLLERLLMVIDATAGAIIYNAADSTVATATVTSNNVVTLSALPGGAASTDKLTVVYDTLLGDPQSVRLAPYASAVTVLSSELSALANNANTAASAAFDNSSTRYPWADLVLSLAAQGSARVSGASILVYMTPRTDGVNYDDVSETVSELVAVYPLDAATTARRRTIRRIPLSPESAKFFVRNSTGQALAASGNTITLVPYYEGSA